MYPPSALASPSHRFPRPSLPPRSSRRRLTTAVLCVLACLAIQASRAAPAAAEAALENAAGDRVLNEVSMVHEIAFQGVMASITSRQIIANPTRTPQQSVYTFDLPLHAAITGFDIRLADGRTSSTAVVDVDVALDKAQKPEGINASPDLGLLRLISRDPLGLDKPSPHALATYELRVFPIAAGAVSNVAIHWSTPLRFDDGRLSLRIPRRGDARNLVRERIQLTLQPPRGARGFTAVHGGGKLLGKRIKKSRFTAMPDSDIVIEALPDLAPQGSRPAVSFAAIPIRDGLGVIGVSMLAPLPRGRSRLSYERAVILIDISRSLGDAGVTAARNMVDGLLDTLPGQASIEVVLFDRTARRVFGTFTRNSAANRKKLARSLRPGQLHNGSDLGAALDLAREIAQKEPLGDAPDPGLERGERAPTLVALISDGMTPIGLDGKRAMGRLGDELADNAEVLSIFLVPDSAPVPDTTRGVMAELAYSTPGRAIAVRHAEASVRARNLGAEINRPAPLLNIEVSAGKAALEGLEIPDRLEPGQGFVAVGFYHGPAPRQVRIVAEQGNAPSNFLAKRSLSLSRMGLALALSSSREDDFVTPAGAAEPPPSQTGATLEEARREMVRAASRARTVTRHSAMVALDSRDRYARDRLASVKKWGPFAFTRLLPPPELAPGYKLRRFSERHRAERASTSASKQRTGELDRGIIERLIETYVVPRARACYQDELRKRRVTHGSLSLIVEIARGEVQNARVVRSTFSGGAVEDCVVDAAYNIQVPRVALGEDPETIGVARYPLRFRHVDNRAQVVTGKSSASERPAIIDPTDPSSGPIDGLQNDQD